METKKKINLHKRNGKFNFPSHSLTREEIFCCKLIVALHEKGLILKDIVEEINRSLPEENKIFLIESKADKNLLILFI